jgi:hypothetical protein
MLLRIHQVLDQHPHMYFPQHILALSPRRNRWYYDINKRRSGSSSSKIWAKPRVSASIPRSNHVCRVFTGHHGLGGTTTVWRREGTVVPMFPSMLQAKRWHDEGMQTSTWISRMVSHRQGKGSRTVKRPSGTHWPMDVPFAWPWPNRLIRLGLRFVNNCSKSFSFPDVSLTRSQSLILFEILESRFSSDLWDYSIVATKHVFASYCNSRAF